MNAVDQLDKHFDAVDTAGKKWWNWNLIPDGKISKNDLKAVVNSPKFAGDEYKELREACQFLLNNPGAFRQLESTVDGKHDGIIGKRDVQQAKAHADSVREEAEVAPVELDSDKPPTSGVSVEQLRQIMPNLSQEKAEAYLPYLNEAMAEANIDTPERQAAFLAQLAHESGEFRYMEEIASGEAYEGRKDLGNTEPGDGKRFKGRGPIQLTGRANYQAASEALGIDLVNNPTRAADPDVGFRTAAWFWTTRGLNELADSGDFLGITKRINGGTNGLADRQAYYERALQVLNAA
jgi:predicted chitinase